MSIYFIANARGTIDSGNSCGCCCEVFKLTPGETNLLEINYSAWTIPMAFKGITKNTSFDLIQLSPPTPAGLLAVQPVEEQTAIGVPLSDSLDGFATGPVGSTFTWSPLPLYGPKNGTFVLNADGSYVYTPASGFNGLEVIYYEVSDGFNKVTGTLAIAVGTVAPQSSHAPAPLVIETNRRNYALDRDTLRVPVTANPDAVQGTQYRLTIRQEGMDCDGGKYYHMSCYDIVIGKC